MDVILQCFPKACKSAGMRSQRMNKTLHGSTPDAHFTQFAKRKGIVVGLLRPPHVFFYEVDNKKLSTLAKLVQLCERHLTGYCYIKRNGIRIRKYLIPIYTIYGTKRGYHVIGYPFRRKIWRIFKNALKTDFTLNLKPRWKMRRYRAQVLRIGSKFTDDNNGVNYSALPNKIMGNFEILGLRRYAIMYRTAK